MIVFADYPLGETRVQREAEVLIQHGYDVDVICVRPPGKPEVDEYKGVHIYRETLRLPAALNGSSNYNDLRKKFFQYALFFLLAAARVTRLHLKKHYNTIQVHNLPDFLVFCTFIPKLLGVPIILDLHDLMPEFYAGRFGKDTSLPARLVRLQERLSCKFASQVITVSEHWKQSLIKRGVPAEKCSVVMNVADDRIFKPTSPDQLNHQTDKKFRLIYHGSFLDRYGLGLVVQAIDVLRHEIPEIHLLLMGKGSYQSELEALVNKLNLQEHVTIEPLHLAEELPQIIGSCDLGIVPYGNDVFTDGLLPTKLMEYAAMGIPAVASRTTAIQAYFIDTNTEFFEPWDLDGLIGCIKKLYYHPERMAELTAGCKKFNQRYNWTVIGAKYFSLVESLGCK